MYTNALLLLLLVSGALLGEAWTPRRRLRRSWRRTRVTTGQPTPSTTPPGCHYQGQVYQPGDTFGEGYDPSSNWCYGAYCSEEGHVLHWDNFQCSTTQLTTTTTPPPTTQPPTTTPPPTTQPPGCLHNGKVYPAGSEIERGYDEATDWCYGLLCDQSAQLLAWDTWNCRKSTTSPTTSPTTAQASTTGSTTQASIRRLWAMLKKYFGLKRNQ